MEKKNPTIKILLPADSHTTNLVIYARVPLIKTVYIFNWLSCDWRREDKFDLVHSLKNNI